MSDPRPTPTPPAPEPAPAPEVENVRATYIAVGDTWTGGRDDSHEGTTTPQAAKEYGIQQIKGGVWRSFSIQQQFTLPGEALAPKRPRPAPIKAGIRGREESPPVPMPTPAELMEPYGA